MALAEGTPGNWGPGSFPVPFQLGSAKPGKRKPALPVKYWPAGPVRLPVPAKGERGGGHS